MKVKTIGVTKPEEFLARIQEIIALRNSGLLTSKDAMIRIKEISSTLEVSK